MKVSDAKALQPGFFTIDEVRTVGGLNLTIKELKREVVAGMQGEREESVLYFLDSPKKIVLNKTRNDQLEDLHGPDEPAGKKVRLEVDAVKVRNRTIEMICIRGTDE